jgi:hypothetical protein
LVQLQHIIGTFTRNFEMGLNLENDCYHPVQSLLSFRLMNVKICETVMFAVSYVCETLSSSDVNLDSRSRVFVNAVVREHLKLEESKQRRDE